MDFPGGFEPSLAYCGFVQMVEEVFSCCLCAVDKKASWKNRKDLVRHLRNFHFGLANRCDTWCDYILLYMCLSMFTDQLSSP